ncbi:MAG TPA: SPOR domain-containing protein [Burkholderiales bacterium]|jgi:DedD protein
MADNDDVNTLKRRGRRRLVGAVALVLAAVIVLPMVFDSDPKGSAPPVSVRIPGEDETAFAPKVTPKSPAIPEQNAADKAPEKAPEKAAEKAVEKAAEKAPEAPAEKPAPKIEITVTKAAEKPAAKADAEKQRAEAALAGGGQFMVPAGAYVDPAGVIEKLKAAKIPYYTEPIATKDGSVTRVRAGPFASRDSAEKIVRQLKALGLKPGSVAPKS